MACLALCPTRLCILQNLSVKKFLYIVLCSAKVVGYLTALNENNVSIKNKTLSFY